MSILRRLPKHLAWMALYALLSTCLWTCLSSEGTPDMSDPITGAVPLGTVSGTQAIDASRGSYFSLTMQGDTALVLSNVSPGEALTVQVNQDSEGGHTLTWAGQAIQGGSGAPAFPTEANSSVNYVFIGASVNLSSVTLVAATGDNQSNVFDRLFANQLDSANPGDELLVGEDSSGGTLVGPAVGATLQMTQGTNPGNSGRILVGAPALQVLTLKMNETAGQVESTYGAGVTSILEDWLPPAGTSDGADWIRKGQNANGAGHNGGRVGFVTGAPGSTADTGGAFYVDTGALNTSGLGGPFELWSGGSANKWLAAIPTGTGNYARTSISSGRKAFGFTRQFYSEIPSFIAPTGANQTVAVDFATGNIQAVSSSATGVLTLNTTGLVFGGKYAYLFVLTTASSVAFSGTTFLFSPADLSTFNAAITAGKQVILEFYGVASNSVTGVASAWVSNVKVMT